MKGPATLVCKNFVDVTDPRSNRGRNHDLLEMVFIALTATICGADGWADIERFAKAKLSWFRRYIKLEHGVPSHDTFGRVFSRLDTGEFLTAMHAWVDSLVTDGFHAASMEMVMVVEQIASFQSCFEIVDDPRVQGRSYHPLNSVLFLVVSAVISGADGPSEIEDFGKEREDWLKQFVDLPHGVPTHDTIGRILSIIKPAQFQKALLAWLSELRQSPQGDGPVVVPIDGKTARGSYTDADKSNALHIVSAWATDHGLTLGQVAVDSKSNEITAVPELLDMLELEGTIVTLDAMGCQKAIAKQQ